MELKKVETSPVLGAVTDKLFILDGKRSALKNKQAEIPEKEYTIVMRDYNEEIKILNGVKTKLEQFIYNESMGI